MSLELPVLFKGAPGSPYTRKMLALLRYRHIRYRLLLGGNEAELELPKPKVGLLPTFYLKDDAGETQAVVDSTPLIRFFEREVTGRPVVPPHPVLRFIDELIEDYADEWLTKAMFHYRWRYRADVDKAGQILPRWHAVSVPEQQIEERRKAITKRQIDRLYVVGSNDTTAPVIEDSYKRFLGIFDGILMQQPFLMGSRPGASDFAVYAQLTQLAHFDPTPMAIALEQAPRVYAWVDVVDDLSGLDPEAEDWIEVDRIRDRLGPLLCEIGRVYAPALLANADAIAGGLPEVDTEIAGSRWVQQPFPYQAKCLSWLRESRAGLDAEHRQAVDAVFSGTGCEALFSDD